MSLENIACWKKAAPKFYDLANMLPKAKKKKKNQQYFKTKFIFTTNNGPVKKYIDQMRSKYAHKIHRLQLNVYK